MIIMAYCISTSYDRAYHALELYQKLQEVYVPACKTIISFTEKFHSVIYLVSVLKIKAGERVDT